MHYLRILDLRHSKTFTNHNLCSWDLQGSGNLSSLPTSIGRLEFLEEDLYLSSTKIKSLPESICTLKLKRCQSIIELRQQNLSNIKSLVHLDIRMCYELRYMPENLKKLSTLRTLSIFILGGKTGCGITELGGLKLEGELFLINLQNVRTVEEAEDARLSDKHGIQSLYLFIKHLGSDFYYGVNAFPSMEALPSNFSSAQVRIKTCNELKYFGAKVSDRSEC